MQRLDVRPAEDFEDGFQAAAARHGDALIVPDDALSTSSRVMITDCAKRYHQLAVYEFRDFVEVGGLMSYGANLREMYRGAATYVDKILKGANPADLPIEQPTRFDFAINLTAAREPAISLPENMLVQTTEFIQ